MKKAICISLVLFCLAISSVFADEIYLSNGETLEGNILNVDKAQGSLDINLVMDGELIGTVMTFKKDEMIYVRQDDQYKELIHKGITPAEKERQLRKLEKRFIQTKIDNKANLKNLEEKRWRERKLQYEINKGEQELEHETEVLKLRHEQRKDLITHSKDELVSPTVTINDSEPYVVNIGTSE